CWLISLFFLFKIGSHIQDKWLGFFLLALGAYGRGSFIISLDIREYALLWCLLTMQFYLFLCLYERMTPRNLALYTLVSVLAIYTHYSAVLTITILGGILIYQQLFLRHHYRYGFWVIIIHLLLAAAFFFSYYQHEFLLLKAQGIIWRDDGYYMPLRSVLFALFLIPDWLYHTAITIPLLVFYGLYQLFKEQRHLFYFIVLS